MKCIEYIESDSLTGEELNAAEQEVLDRVNQKVAGAQSLEAVTAFLFEQTGTIFPCDRMGIAFLEDHDTRLVSKINRARYEPLFLKEGYSEGYAGSSVKPVIDSGSLRIIHDLEHYRELHPGSASANLLIKEGVCSSMTCPLNVEGRTVGVLFRSSRHKRAYNRHEAALHMSIAERLSQAVEKTWRIEQLQVANRGYMEMLGFVSHELKSPLNAMLMKLQLFKQGYLGEITQKQLGELERMERQAQFLTGLIHDYLNLARIESGEMRVSREEVNVVKDIVEPVLDLLQAHIEEHHCEVSTHIKGDLRPVMLDRELMTVVMTNLVGNAIKYGKKGGCIKISLSTKHGFRTSVWNEGPGFSSSDKQRLFRKFSRLKKPELRQQKGSGVGLYTTWQIIQAHGGHIWADSQEGAWAEFTFEI